MELLNVKKCGYYWKVLNIHNSEVNQTSSNEVLLRASRNTIDLVDKELKSGNLVFIPLRISSSEVGAEDLFIATPQTTLTTLKNIALREISNLMDRNIFGVSVIDSMDYINSAMDLMNNGIFITEDNREDKYLEIIEASQSNMEPEPLKEGASFEEERQYMDELSKHKIAQHNLATLEKYLNALDKLSKIKFVDNLLNTYKAKVSECESEDKIIETIKEYQNALDRYFYNPEG